MAVDGTASRIGERRRLLTECLASDTRAPWAARHLVAEALAASGAAADGSLDDTLLMVSELVTNACVHAGSDITLRVFADGRALRVEVADGGQLPPVLEPWDGQVGGLGLQLVDNLADRWGWEPARGGGKVVWFERRVPVQL